MYVTNHLSIEKYILMASKNVMAEEYQAMDMNGASSPINNNCLWRQMDQYDGHLQINAITFIKGHNPNESC